MPRLRYLGRPAANADDILTKRQLDAALAALPGQYLELSRLNLANGVPQLDANARMGNSYLPTDISRTTLTSSGKTKAGTLEVTGASVLAGLTAGASTLASLSVTGGATVGGTLGVSGAITGASLDVGSGQLTAATESVPENVASTFKAKATTLDSLTVGGSTNLSTLTMSGSLVAQSLSATAITASGQVQGGTLRSLGSLIVEGAASLQGATLAGTLSTQVINANDRINAINGLRLGNGASLTQVDGVGTLVPVQFGNGAIVNGPLTNVTSMSTSGALTVGSLQVNGAVNATGKGVFNDLQSNSNLQIYGTLLGVTDLDINGNLTVMQAGKSISALLVTADKVVSPLVEIANNEPVTNTHLRIANTQVRQNNSRFERYSSVVSNWVPNMVQGICQTTMSVSPTFAIPTGATTKINMVTTELNSSTVLFTPNINGGIRVNMAGWYEITAGFTITCLSNKQVSCSIRINDTVQPGSVREFRPGTFGNEAGSNGWGYVSAQTTWAATLSAGDVITFHAYQATGFDADIQKTSVWRPILVVKWMGTN